MCIVLLADHMDNSLTIELGSHDCTFGLRTFFIPLSSTCLCAKPKIHPKHLLKQAPFLFVSSPTARSCGGGRGGTRGEIYSYAKYVYLMRLPSIFLPRKRRSGDKRRRGAGAALMDDMEYVQMQKKSKEDRIHR